MQQTAIFSEIYLIIVLKIIFKNIPTCLHDTLPILQNPEKII